VHFIATLYYAIENILTELIQYPFGHALLSADLGVSALTCYDCMPSEITSPPFCVDPFNSVGVETQSDCAGCGKIKVLDGK